MLRLERIDVSGFKSFPDPVSLVFSGGTTAIVGPNGCGKSNLADAISWVMGEQSAKTLRGDRMEDVIFNGAERRSPLGLAEVTMHLATDPGTPGAEDGRVTLSRRVFRDGEGQYRINGKLMRLKDFRDLLMDTGLGIRAYSVIEQGKVGMILSGKPQERRRLLEEAAGVTRYKTRKRIAEVKLEEAVANLQRLDDIISEVDRALKSLKRQAAAARRYREREAEYRELLERVLLGRWGRLMAHLAGVAERLAEAVDREAELSARLHKSEADLAAGRERADELAQELADLHERHSSLGARIEGRQELLRSRHGAVAEVSERAAAAAKLADEREGSLAGHGASLSALAARRAELVSDLEVAEAEAGEGARRLATAEERLAASAARLEERRRELLAAAAEINGVRSRLHQEQIEAERAGTRRRLLAEEGERYAVEVGSAEEQLAIARDTAAALGRRLAEKEEEQERLERALEETLRREAAAIERRRRIDTELSGARQREDLLARLAASHAEGRAALERALEAAGSPAPVYLADRLSAAQGWERALDFYLGGLADAVLVPDGRSALALAQALSGASAGGSLLAPVAPPGDAWPQVDDAAVGLSLGQALGLDPALAAALPPAFLVDRAADAERLARRHPGVAFLSPDGLWAQGGLLHVEGAETIPGVLERERERTALEARLPELEAALAESTGAVESLVAERAERARDSHRLAGEIGQLRQESAVAAARAQDAEDRHRRLAAEAAEVARARGEVEAELAGRAEASRGLAAAAERAEARQAELQEAFDLGQSSLDSAKGEKENLRAESAGRESRLELLRERLAAHDREAARVGNELAEGERQVRQWREEAARLSARRAELEAEIARAEAELQASLEESARAEDEVLTAQQRLDDHRAAIREMGEGIGRTRGEHEEARSAVEELRVEQAALRQEGEHLSGDFRERFDREPPAPPPPAPDDLAELEADLARRKEVLDRMGPVNALAVEEYAEQEERFTFLTAQRADVVASVESLRKTIREINQTSGARFQETFVEVNKSFGEVFSRLFRGGEAEMRLLDEEDLLESGIEIVARPPGKRLQNIMLLSGGEKALTAIALLFALFRTKPSPFCILDEVDAPLDDANALRFVELVREMATDTQFIVITHNKLTMQIAQTLYGVTMEERGVSKVVSVELDEVQPEPVAATA